MEDHEARSEPGGLSDAARRSSEGEDSPPSFSRPESVEHSAASPENEGGAGCGRSGSLPSQELEESWRQIRKLAESVDAAGDPVVVGALEEALKTKLSALRQQTETADRSLLKFTKVKVLYAELQFMIPEPEPESELEDGSLLPPATPEQLAQAENLIRQARVHTMRGDRDGARKLLEEAANAAPGSAAVLEALGDELTEQGKKRQALEYYKRALALDPKNVALDKKHAFLTFNALAASQAFYSPASDLETVASAKAAVWMSFFCPGLGQLVSGRVLIGGIIMGVWLASLVGLIAIGYQHVFYVIGLTKPPPGVNANPVIFLPVATGLVFHIMAIADASSNAKKTERLKPLRPKPPSDLPFE